MTSAANLDSEHTPVREGPLYRVPVDKAARLRAILLTTSLGASAALLVLTLLLLDGHAIAGLHPSQWTGALTAAIVIGMGPYGALHHIRLQRIRRLEDRFPDFLRDIAIARRSGLTLANAVQVSARGDYGELTPELRRMADQIGWGLTFGEALDHFTRRVQAPQIERTVALIQEAGRSGGSITDVILAAARDARETRTLEDERRISMGLYVAIIYITFLVFLGIVTVMQTAFIPEVLAAGDASTAAAAAGVGALDFSGITLQQYHQFYYMAALAQGVGNGLVAGIIENGRIASGLRHSVAMALIAWLAFAFI